MVRDHRHHKQSVLDEVSYTLKKSADIDAMFAKARADAKPPQGSPVAPFKKALPPPFKSVDAIRTSVGTLAHGRLVRAGARFDEKYHADAKTLRALLVKKRYAPHGAVVSFEKEFGGLLVPESSQAHWLEDEECQRRFRGDKRSNETHESTTDDEARLAKKAKTAKVACYAGPGSSG